jgi:TonB family C-terminal domain
MARDIDLTSPQWLDIVFKGKNKEYGAYVMRRDSSNRHIWALIIMLVVGSLLMFLPGLIESVMPEEKIEVAQTDAVTMVDLDNQDIPEDNVIEQIEYVPPPPLLAATIQFTPPVVTTEEVNADEMMATQQELTESNAAISIATVEGVEEGGVNIADIVEHVVVTQVEPVKPEIHTRVEQMPTFPGGNGELYKHLYAEIKYPQMAQAKGTQGTVALRFVVLPDGSIGEVQIQRGVDKELDEEAVRAVKKLPKFIPGRQNGQPVSVWFSLPVKFELK